MRAAFYDYRFVPNPDIEKGWRRLRVTLNSTAI